MSQHRSTTVSFSDDIAALAALDLSLPIKIAAIEDILGVRGYAGIIIVLIAPFLQPVPIPGLSVIIGIIIMLIGVRILLGKQVSLPTFIGQKTIDGTTLKNMLKGAQKIFGRLERYIHPRLGWVNDGWLGKSSGIAVIIGGLALSLPIPSVILFSNSLPALGLLFLSVGQLERDGAAILAGHLLVVSSWVYFYFIADLIMKIFNWH